MMLDPRLSAVLRAADVLDDPKLTKQRIASCRQVCAVIADSFLCTIRVSVSANGDDGSWLDNANFDASGAPLDQHLGYQLALNTVLWIDQMSDAGTSDGAIRFRAHIAHEWAKARRNAEELVFGEVRAATQVALDRLEHRGAALVAGVAMKEMGALPEARPTAWSFD
jgi:hypothetical protein